MNDSITTAFRKSFERDKSAYIKSWLVKWDYQEKRRKRRLEAQTGEPADFFNYHGPQDFVEWINWLKEPNPNYLGRLTDEPARMSERNDRAIFERIGAAVNWEHYKSNIDIMNAHDFLFPNFYPQPARCAIRNILDFGAGYGRQANLWTTKLKEYTFIGMDAIPKTYCMQNRYYHATGKPVVDYIEQENFGIDFQRSGIWHVPTWRYDLVPDQSLDLILCVQVLPELNSTLVKTMIRQFFRMLKPGAMLYIRDHGQFWRPAGAVNADDFAVQNGFVMEFCPHLVLEKEIHGIPRIYRKIHPEVMQSQTPSLKRKTRQHLENIDAAMGGSLNRLSKQVRKLRNK